MPQLWESGWEAQLAALADRIDLITGLETLDVTIDHALGVGDLPAHHTDPFDRLLVAQARTDELTLVTRDRHIPLYGVAVLPA